jgi:hypothetical protein
MTFACADFYETRNYSVYFYLHLLYRCLFFLNRKKNIDIAGKIAFTHLKVWLSLHQSLRNSQMLSCIKSTTPVSKFTEVGGEI